jgi:hypothetical protein
LLRLFITGQHGSAKQVIVGHVVSKAKLKICAPHSSQTDEARNTIIGVKHHSLNLTPAQNLIKIGGQGPELQNHQSMWILVFSFFPISFVQATDQTAELIVMVDGINDMSARNLVPIGGNVIK